MFETIALLTGLAIALYMIVLLIMAACKAIYEAIRKHNGSNSR